jgi:hypothetical protein
MMKVDKEDGSEGWKFIISNGLNINYNYIFYFKVGRKLMQIYKLSEIKKSPVLFNARCECQIDNYLVNGVLIHESYLKFEYPYFQLCY